MRCSKYFSYCLILFFFLTKVNAKDIEIFAIPGGVYNLPKSLHNVRIKIIGSGSQTAPFRILGDSNKSVMTGESSIFCIASYVSIENVIFSNNNIDPANKALVRIGTVTSNSTKNVVIKKCDFRFLKVFPDSDIITQFFWIQATAPKTIIDQCTFEGKQNRLPIIHIDAGYQGNIISNCIFKNVKSRAKGALEAIRVGLTKGSSNCKIINNTFSNYFGDSETISIKADGASIIGNKFIKCRSGVCIRWGDNCTIKSNSFINTISPVRIAGSGNRIEKNVFRGQERGITLMKGGPSYKAIKSLTIIDNIFYDGFYLRILESENSFTLPENIKLKGNKKMQNGKKVIIKDRLINSDFFKKDFKNETRKDRIKAFKYSVN